MNSGLTIDEVNDKLEYEMNNPKSKKEQHERDFNKFKLGFCQWTHGTNGIFTPSSKTTESIPAGVYCIEKS